MSSRTQVNATLRLSQPTVLSKAPDDPFELISVPSRMNDLRASATQSRMLRAWLYSPPNSFDSRDLGNYLSRVNMTLVFEDAEPQCCHRWFARPQHPAQELIGCLSFRHQHIVFHFVVQSVSMSHASNPPRYMLYTSCKSASGTALSVLLPLVEAFLSTLVW
jgi:hypothetical protein